MTTGGTARCSVIVCTYNRAALLALMLDTLAAQRPALDADCEVIVVDNNSADATAEVIRDAAHTLPLRRVREPAQGLSHARNRGLAEAAGDLLVFADDDVLLEPGWLAAYRDAARDFPGGSFFGGRIRPHWPDGRPGWVRDENMALLAGIFGCCDHGEATRAYRPGEDGPMGANFALRRALVDAVGGFDPAFGRSGGDLGRGEEAEFFKRARDAGHQGVYVGAAFCEHHVEAHRLGLAALYRYGLASARSHRALADPHAQGSAGAALAYLARGAAQLLKGRGDRFRQCIINAGIQMGLRR